MRGIKLSHLIRVSSLLPRNKKNKLGTLNEWIMFVFHNKVSHWNSLYLIMLLFIWSDLFITLTKSMIIRYENMFLEAPLNPYPAVFSKWNNQTTVYFWSCPFWRYQDENLCLVSHQLVYRDRSDCTDEQACLAVYWWQRLITFSSSKILIMVNVFLNQLTQLCSMMATFQP